MDIDKLTEKMKRDNLSEELEKMQNDVCINKCEKYHFAYSLKNDDGEYFYFCLFSELIEKLYR